MSLRRSLHASADRAALLAARRAVLRPMPRSSLRPLRVLLAIAWLGQALGQSSGLNGEQACEGHGYDSDACAAVGCCYYDSTLNGCFSSVGQGCCDSNMESCDPPWSYWDGSDWQNADVDVACLPPMPPSPPWSPCTNDCVRWNGWTSSWDPFYYSYAYGAYDMSADGVCDDGGPGSQYDGCMYGSDCEDCGVRAGPSPPQPPQLPPPPPSAPDLFQTSAGVVIVGILVSVIFICGGGSAWWTHLRNGAWDRDTLEQKQEPVDGKKKRCAT